jgi:hypothetical protein
MTAAGGVSPAEEFGKATAEFPGGGACQAADQAEAVRRAKDTLAGRNT